MLKHPQMNKIILPIIFSLLISNIYSQQKTDTSKENILDDVTVRAKLSTVSRLNDVDGTRINNGKKNEVLLVQNLDANIAEKTPRQIFAKVPGVFVYDMDGTGNQVNISVRGLDPHRGWEFNIRKNNVITNS